MKFVILDHIPAEPSSGSAARTQQRHFDLMFEVDGQDSLRTLALIELPLELAAAVEFISLENHRSEYLAYEGPVSNNRGSVIRHAYGCWSGKLSETAVLSFDSESKFFTGSEWTIKIDSSKNSLIRIA